MNISFGPGVRIRRIRIQICMDPPILALWIWIHGTFFGGNYGDFYIKIYKNDLRSTLKADILSDMLLIKANK